MQQRRAFTLIELLVVVAIITALLAMLLPSLNRAVYAAQLAVCSSNLHQIGLGTLNYAADHRGAFPHRPNIAPSSHEQPGTLASAGTAFDWRPVIRNHIDLNGATNCPLNGDVDYLTDAGTQNMWMDYNIYAGFQFNGGDPMKRIGQRFSVGGNRFGVLAADRDLVMPGRPELQSAHPDRAGVMRLAVQQDSADLWGTRQITISIWSNFGNYRRGPIDQNFLHDDLSVRTLNAVTYDDPRLVKVPIWADGTEFPGAYSQLPAMGR